MLRGLVALLLGLFVLMLTACEVERVPPLLVVREMSPREIELGDRLELHGSGFPQGRNARVTLRGTLHRAGEGGAKDARVSVEGKVVSEDRIEVIVTDALEEALCGHGDHAIHTTLRGEVEVAFASSASGAPPLVGILHDITLDAMPSSVRARVLESRRSEGLRVLSFLGLGVGAASARGLPIDRVEPGGLAEKAGFQAGDFVTVMDGTNVRDVSDVVPASMRTARISVQRAGSLAEETITVPMVGYFGHRVPAEYLPVLVVVGIALAALLLAVWPVPARALALELRVAKRLRGIDWRRIARTPALNAMRAAQVALSSVLLFGVALGHQLALPDFDVAVLVLATVACFLAARLVVARTAKSAAVDAWGAIVFGLVLVAAVVGTLVDRGALRLAEIVRVQGGLPWDFAAFRYPASFVLAGVYLAALVGLGRARDPRSLSDDVAGTAPNAIPTHGTERLGVLAGAALAVALFFGGWQIPGAQDDGSRFVQIIGAVFFVGKAWILTALVISARTIASPWSNRRATSFVLRVLFPALGGAGVLACLTRMFPPSEAVEAIFGRLVAFVLALVVLRAILRVREAMTHPEPHASPFL